MATLGKHATKNRVGPPPILVAVEFNWECATKIGGWPTRFFDVFLSLYFLWIFQKMCHMAVGLFASVITDFCSLLFRLIYHSKLRLRISSPPPCLSQLNVRYYSTNIFKATRKYTHTQKKKISQFAKYLTTRATPT